MYRESALLARGIAVLALLCVFIAGCSRESKINNPAIQNAPDGSSSLICFFVLEGGSWKIKVLNPTSDSIFQIADIGGSEVCGLAWSPDKSQIAFASDRSGSMELWVISSDGIEISQVTGLSKSPLNASCFSPSWENADYLVYSTITGGSDHSEIARIHIDGGQQQILRIYDEISYCCSAPRLSDDLTKLACVVSTSISSDQSNILVANYPYLGNKHIVNIPGQNACHPKWSVNGLLVFDEAASGIYTVLPSGAELLNISGIEHYGDRSPVFSPGGGQIAFLSAESGNMNIYIMNLDGTNRQQKTNAITGTLISYLDW